VLLEISRNHQKTTGACFSKHARELLPLPKDLSGDALRSIAERTLTANPSLSLLHVIETYFLPSIPVRSALGTVSLYQLNPEHLRSPGIVTPILPLDRGGLNLPFALRALQDRDWRAYQAVLSGVRIVMPSLDEISIERTPHNTLELRFTEHGFNGVWTADEVSDGTMRALGLLTALFDPASKLVILEEPENSLHPWAISEFIDACRLTSKSKQVILTTHSPAVIDRIRPEDVWIVSKKEPETRIDRLVDLDPDAKSGLEAGDYTLADYLDSGIVRQAVPTLT